MDSFLALPPRSYIYGVMMARSKQIMQKQGAPHPDRGNWICTASGTRFFPLCPSPDEVNMEDIAHSLSLKCRWGGHCNRFYSVAEHSMRVADVAVVNFRRDNREWDREKAKDELRLELFALLHDAHEAYLADVPKPIKPMLDWKKHEEAVDRAIWQHLGLAWVPEIGSWADRVHRADMVLLRIEATELFDPDKARVQSWQFSGIEPAPWELAAADYTPQDPKAVEKEFLARANYLIKQIGDTYDLD